MELQASRLELRRARATWGTRQRKPFGRIINRTDALLYTSAFFTLAFNPCGKGSRCPTEDGKPKVFRDTVVSMLTEFFERFRRMNVRSNDQLDQLVSQVEDLVQGVQPKSLRENRVLRQSIAAELSQLQPAFDGLLVDRPRRNILRQAGAIPVQETA